MRSELRAVWLAVAAAVALAGCKQETKNGQRVQLLFTTDEHSHLFAIAPERDDFPLATAPGAGALVGGIARRATILQAQRAEARARGVDTLTFSVGDFSQGTLAGVAFGMTAPELGSMKALGYDAAAIGNHEFDLGPQGLAASIAAAEGRSALPPLVLTNAILDPNDPRDQALASMYGAGKEIAPSRVLVTPGGRTVGVVADLGPAAAKVAGGAAPVRFWDPAVADPYTGVVQLVQPAIDALRAQGVEFVVLLSHGGIGPVAGASGDDEKLAGMLRGVDVVLSGHSHRAPDAPRMVESLDGRTIPVVQPAPYGREVGRVELVLGDDGIARIDPARTAFLKVDDTTVPTTDPVVLGELNGVVHVLEDVALPGVGASFLEATLAGITGGPVSHTAPGDLYFYKLGHTTFDVKGLAPGETDAMDLDTDAMLATARTIAGAAGTVPPVAALQASGAVRGDLAVGETGDLSFADVYRVAPLGVDPTTSTPGYPLVVAAMSTVELKDALELSLLQSMTDGDFFLGVAGMRVEYDKTRPPLPYPVTDPTAPGWITKVTTLDPAGNDVDVLYDASQANPWGTTAMDLQTIVTTYQIGAFAGAFGVTLRDPQTGAPYASLGDAVLSAGGPPVKDSQSLAGYVWAVCQHGTADLPPVYQQVSLHGPQRMVCGGAICP